MICKVKLTPPSQLFPQCFNIGHLIGPWKVVDHLPVGRAPD
jgi:hypothetical protein